ncbi:MAG: translation elongation factor 4 [Candidatus Wolfebacteria bacterium]|nr:translation elongation factor 4 [Candidatus Wolfebacteria bacterium]
MENIRNFVIIAHVDHGKSTLADRFLEMTGTVDMRHMKPQFLDSLELERERGITIKMAPVRMLYEYKDKEYILNLIDTPGHSDFSYEVSRALESVEGAILLVDATQGIQAQTLVNFRSAKKAGLRIIGAVNKIDIQGLDPKDVDRIVKEAANLLGIPEDEIFRVSGKTGHGVKELLDEVVRLVPPPRQHKSILDAHKTAFQSLIFDCLYDEHKGIIAFVRVFAGEYKSGMETKLIATNEKFKIKEVGYFSPKMKVCDKLKDGEIGYIATGIKDYGKLQIGDTIGDEALPGYKEPKPVVFVSLYPDDSNQYEDFKASLLKLKLNDSSLNIEPDMNEVLGRGFKCGFLGQLHFEITAERLEREFNIDTIGTFPFVAYKIRNQKGECEFLKTIDDMPPDATEIMEPIINLSIICPVAFLGGVLSLKEKFRIEGINTENLDNRILMTATMPLSSLLSDFDGQLKSVSQGMASFSYELGEYKRADLEKVEILVANEVVPGLTRLMYKDELAHESRKMLAKLKEVLPSQQFSQSLQAKVGGRIIARENITAMRKDVTGYLYGGDRTRKMKLWKKQKRGKEKLKKMGRVNISANDFKELLKK